MKELHPYEKLAKRNTHFRGVVYGFARSMLCFSYAAVFYYGAMLVRDENIDYGRIFT